MHIETGVIQAVETAPMRGSEKLILELKENKERTWIDVISPALKKKLIECCVGDIVEVSVINRGSVSKGSGLRYNNKEAFSIKVL